MSTSIKSVLSIVVFHQALIINQLNLLRILFLVILQKISLLMKLTFSVQFTSIKLVMLYLDVSLLVTVAITSFIKTSMFQTLGN